MNPFNSARIMNTQSVIENDSNMITGQAQIYRHVDGIIDAMAIRCCVELNIADIISNHNRPTKLSEIATAIDSPSINMNGLGRLMRFLGQRKVFDEMQEDGEREAVYSLNHCSKFLLKDTNLTMAPWVMATTDPYMVSPKHMLSLSIKEGGTPFKKTHGKEFFDFSMYNLQFNKAFNEGMACTAKINMNAIITNYRNGFLGSKGSIVDVGGGIGVAISEIVKAYPHLKGINFDMPHVISTAPTYEGVTHVAGDMFKSIPPAETIFMKWVLHDWSDEDCVKILQNCRKAIPKEAGKVIIIDIIQHHNDDSPFINTRHTFDLAMFTNFHGGRERTESEWKKLLGESGFFHYNVINIPSIPMIIEAFPF